MTKTTVFNLIILDESGSMQPNTKAAIDGCNENLNIIRGLQEENKETQRFLTSIYAFQSGNRTKPSRYIRKNVPIESVTNITEKDYQPWGGTPLLDAIGSTITDLMNAAETHEDATGSITIITDGYENSSTQYSPVQISRLISQVREMGWNVNLIGANIDVDAFAKQMNIQNSMAFEANEEGTYAAMETLNRNMEEYHRDRITDEERLRRLHPDSATYKEEVIKMRKAKEKDFFKR